MWFLIVISGIAAGLMDQEWPPAEALLLLVLLAILLLKKARRSRLHCALGLLILAYLYSNVYLAVLFSGTLPQRLAGETLIVQGQVLEVLRQETDQQQLSFRIDTCFLAADLDCEFSGQVVLNRYLPENTAFSAPVHSGEYWRFAVRLYPVRGFVNPGQGRYRLLQLSKGIMARGSVRLESFSQKLGGETGLATWKYDWLSSFEQRLSNLRAGGETSVTPVDPAAAGTSSGVALVTALLSGSVQQVSAAQWSLLQQTGTLHLVVVSGLHLSVLLGLGWMLSGLIARALPLDRRPQRLVLTMLPLLLLLPMLWVWPSGVAVFRALLMVLFVLVLRVKGYRVNPVRILMLAVLLLLLSDPIYLLRPGFYYSVWAVMLLLLIASGRQRGLFLRIQLVLTLGLLPVQQYWLASPDLAAVLANLVAIPLVSVLILPLSLILLFLPLESGLLLLTELEQLFWQWLQLCQSLSWGAAPQSGPALLLFLVTALMLALPAHPLRAGALLTALACSVGLVVLNDKKDPEGLPFGKVQIRVLDIGQGLAVLINQGDRLLVYDSGPRFRSGFMPVASVIPPLLTTAGLRIDTLVISHDDQDHAGGLEALLPFTDQILAGQPERLSNQVQGLPEVVACQAGLSWRWGDLQIRALYPPAESGEMAAARSDNSNSCVLHLQSVTQPELSLLLTGDIDREDEAWLLASGQNLHASWLVASHHGSAAGNSLAFLAEVRPRGVIYSAGFGNSYGHPANAVQQRIAYLKTRHGASGSSGENAYREYNTADLGALILTSEAGSDWVLSAQREQLPLRWRWQH